MKNNNGFTLTELLVTIAIMGVITMIAFPAISKLRAENDAQQYESYKQVMLNGAKLYADQYGGNMSNGKCYIIDLNQLISAKFIKKYASNSEEAAGKIIITKVNNGYTYKVALTIKKIGGNIIYNNKDEGYSEAGCIY